MLELVLFGNLDDRQKLDAALILDDGINDVCHALGYLQQPELVPVVGLRPDGTVVAVYGLHPFLRRESGVLRNSEHGFVAARPKGQCIGSEMVMSLRPVFEGLAHLAGVHAVVHEVATKKPNLFVRLGYRQCGSRDGGLKLYIAEYFPKPQGFTVGEKKIVDQFTHAAQPVWI